MKSILLVDDDTLSREMLATYIGDLLGFNLDAALNGDEAFSLFMKNNYSVVITDIKMPGMNGLELLSKIKSTKKGKSTKVVLLTGFADMDTAIQAIRNGASDYLVKPVDIYRLGQIISEEGSKSIEFEDINHNNSIPAIDSSLTTPNKLTIAGIDGNIGVFSKELSNIVNMCYKLHKDRSITALIQGESGTGKEIIASLIHHGLNGSDKPFITINCAAISPSLFESEIFGYEAGAFTGSSNEGKIGKLELAQGGTILLDEIGEMLMDMQVKLLRVIQERKFYRVGGTKEIKLDIRIIASTNKDLEVLVKENKFRYDLFYRINSTTLLLPRLNEQVESIAALAQMFLIEFSEKKKKKFRIISKNAVTMLEQHDWKGNIRELRNVVERVVLLYDDYELREDHLSFLGCNLDSMASGKNILRLGSFELPDEGINLEQLECEIVEKALSKFGGNKTKTAKFLGLTPSSLRSRIK